MSQINTLAQDWGDNAMLHGELVIVTPSGDSEWMPRLITHTNNKKNRKHEI